MNQGRPPDGEPGVLFAFDPEGRPCLLRWDPPTQHTPGCWIGLRFKQVHGSDERLVPESFLVFDSAPRLRWARLQDPMTLLPKERGGE